MPALPRVTPLARALALAALVVAAWLPPGCGAPGPSGTLPTQTLTLQGQRITVELALNPADRLQGLSDRESLADDRGMLFVFPGEKPMAFVMRRCHFDIDIAFINAAGRVVATHQMAVEPFDRAERDLTPYPSGAPALMAIELNAGGLERYGLAPGVQLDLPVLALKRRAR